MTGIDARPRSATEIVDSAFNILRQRYAPFVTASAIMYIPVIALTLAGFGIGANPTASTMNGATAVAVFFQLIWVGLTNAVLSVMTSQIYVGGEPDAGAAIRLTLTRSWSVVLASIATTIAAFFGMIFFIIPGIYLYARYGLSPVIAAIEGTGPGVSLSRASRLSENNKKHYLATLALVLILYLVVSTVATFVFALSSLPAITIIANAAITVFLLPFVGTVQALIYYDLRIRNEGYDLQLMSDRLAGQPTPATG